MVLPLLKISENDFERSHVVRRTKQPPKFVAEVVTGDLEVVPAERVPAAIGEYELQRNRYDEHVTISHLSVFTFAVAPAAISATS